MKKLLVMLCFLAVGCSNAPLAGFLDTVNPSRVKTEPPLRDRLPPPALDLPR